MIRCQNSSKLLRMGVGLDTQARDLLIKQLLDEIYDKLKEAKQTVQAARACAGARNILGSYPYIDGSRPNHL